MMRVIDTKTWRVLTAAIMVCALSLMVAGVALASLHSSDGKKAVLIAENRALIDKQAATQDALRASDARNAKNVELALQRQLALTRFVLELQGQVRTLGATPLPLPSDLQKPPAFEVTTPPAARPTPTPSAAPSPRPTPPLPRPTPSPAPTPTPSPTCLVKVGPLCV